MKKDIEEFFAKCLNCQQIKAEHQNPSGLLKEFEFPTWKWEGINMDFLMGLTRIQNSYDSIWVVMDWLTKSSCFIPIKSTYSEEDYARIFIDEIIYRHGIPFSIISDRSASFTSKFWRSFQKGLVTMVKLCTTFQPQRMVKRNVLFKPLRIF